MPKTITDVCFLVLSFLIYLIIFQGGKLYRQVYYHLDCASTRQLARYCRSNGTFNIRKSNNVSDVEWDAIKGKFTQALSEIQEFPHIASVSAKSTSRQNRRRRAIAKSRAKLEALAREAGSVDVEMGVPEEEVAEVVEVESEDEDQIID
jgi:hypothetical protein